MKSTAINPARKVHRSRKIAPPVRLFVWSMALLTLCCMAAEQFCGYVLHLGGPHDYPFLLRIHTFQDFTLFQYRFTFFHTPGFFSLEPTKPFMYPLTVGAVYQAFFIWPHPLVVFLSFLCVSFALAGFLLYRALVRRGVERPEAAAFILACILPSYPFWFDFKQANIEIVVWVLVALGVWAFCKHRSYSAAACFGLAGSMKIFPFVYLGLLLAKRQYRQMAFSVLVASVATLTSIWLVGGNQMRATWQVSHAALDHFRVAYMLEYHRGEMSFDHSLFGLYKAIAGARLPPPEVVAHILNFYLPIVALAGTALYFIRIRHLPIVNQVMCLSVASVLLPPVSFDYTLLHLYVPLAMLVLFAQQTFNPARQKIAGLIPAFLCFAILVSPETEVIYHKHSVAGQIKAVVLLILFYIAVRYPFPITDPSPHRVALETASA